MSSIANLPKTYKAALQKEAGKPFEFIDVEMKEPGPGKVICKVLACGVCHSDSIVKNQIMPVLPKIPGHEIGMSQGKGRDVLLTDSGFFMYSRRHCGRRRRYVQNQRLELDGV
jgi:D-arabinose 1-dehydrogenase-like Zn-dependent alcohol dehydrogenase